jgi:D-alanyl-D-alanine carboxypeptidase (penicillin-binding protein 5/6)
MNQIKKYVAAFVLILSMLCPLCVSASEPPTVQSESAILIDADTGRMLYGKNENNRAYPASTTKIMVALLALENLQLDETVTASASALSLLPSGHTNIGILAGESLSVRQLLYAMMLSSAGDAANVLAERISGSVDEFVKLMNQRALELGMTSTNYMNASGAHDEYHYTTAADMAILAREVMKNDAFREIVATDLYIIPATEQYPEERRLSNTNHLVSKRRTSKYYYKYATGIKTGFTNQAKLCLVSSAEKNGVSLICVTLGADTIDDQMVDFVDSKNLFEYGFENFRQVSIVKANTLVAQAPIKSAKRAKQVLLEASDDLTRLYGVDEEVGKVECTEKINEKIKAPVKKGDVLGTAEYFVDSVSVGTVDLIADKDYAFDPVKNVLGVLSSIFTSPFLYLPFFLIFVGMVVMRQYNYNKRKKQRIAAMREQRRREAEERRKHMSEFSYFDESLK